MSVPLVWRYAMGMTRTRFRSLNKKSTRRFLLTKFEDPNGEFDKMSAEELTNYGIDNWDESWEAEDAKGSSKDSGKTEKVESASQDAEEGEGEASEDEAVTLSEGEEDPDFDPKEDPVERSERLDLGYQAQTRGGKPKTLDLG